MRSLPSGIMGNGIPILILTKICVGRCALISMQHILNTHLQCKERGNMFVFVHRCRWVAVCEKCSNELCSVDFIVLGHSFKWKQNQHTKYFLTSACGYMSRPKPFSTQHNISVCEKNLVHKNLTVAGKTRSNFSNTFYSFLFLAIVNYFLPYNGQTIQIQFSYKKCCQRKKNEEAWYD